MESAKCRYKVVFDADGCWHRELRDGKEGGTGTELKRLLASAGILPNGCQCDARAALMDANGPEWCKDNIHTIVGWLAAEAQERGIPFPKVGIWLLVQAAIASARKSCFDTAPLAE